MPLLSTQAVQKLITKCYLVMCVLNICQRVQYIFFIEFTTIFTSVLTITFGDSSIVELNLSHVDPKFDFKCIRNPFIPYFSFRDFFPLFGNFLFSHFRSFSFFSFYGYILLFSTDPKQYLFKDLYLLYLYLYPI